MKKGFKKVMALILSGFLLGSVAGVTLYGVTSIAKIADPVGKIVMAIGLIDENVRENTPNKESSKKKEETLPTIQNTETFKVATVTDVSEIAKEVMPSLVSIVNEYTAVQNFGYFGATRHCSTKHGR